MDFKTGPPVQLKVVDEAQGQVQAVFSTLNVVDKDGDVTLPGAFGQQNVRISAYNHTSWAGALPVGKGTISEVGNEAILDGQFFMNIPAARETFLTVKALDDPAMEWSYGYDVLERSQGKFPQGDEKGEDVQFLHKLKVFEVSPVLLGAGIDTRTLSAKGNDRRPPLSRRSAGEVELMHARLLLASSMKHLRAPEPEPDWRYTRAVFQEAKAAEWLARH